MNTKKKAGIRSLLPLFCIISLLLAGCRPTAELETAPEPLPYEPDTAPRSAVPPAERLLSYQVAGSGFYQMPDEQRFSTALYAYNTCYFNQIRDQLGVSYQRPSWPSSSSIDTLSLVDLWHAVHAYRLDSLEPGAVQARLQDIPAFAAAQTALQADGLYDVYCILGVQDALSLPLDDQIVQQLSQLAFPWDGEDPVLFFGNVELFCRIQSEYSLSLPLPDIPSEGFSQYAAALEQQMASGELDILNIRAYFALRGHYPAQCSDIEDSLFSYLETFQGPSGQFSLLPYDEEDLFSIDIQSLAAALSLYQGQDRTFPVEPSALLRQCMAFERTDLQFNSFEDLSSFPSLPFPSSYGLLTLFLLDGQTEQILPYLESSEGAESIRQSAHSNGGYRLWLMRLAGLDPSSSIPTLLDSFVQADFDGPDMGMQDVRNATLHSLAILLQEAKVSQVELSSEIKEGLVPILRDLFSDSSLPEKYYRIYLLHQLDQGPAIDPDAFYQDALADIRGNGLGRLPTAYYLCYLIQQDEALAQALPDAYRDALAELLASLQNRFGFYSSPTMEGELIATFAATYQGTYLQRLLDLDFPQDLWRS